LRKTLALQLLICIHSYFVLLFFALCTGVQQVIQIVPIPKQVINVPERADSLATHDLVFKAANLPPLGFRSYYVTKVSSSFTEVTPSDELFIGDAVSTVLAIGVGLNMERV
jgi:hypothetical protein